MLGDFQCCPSPPPHQTSNRIGKPNHLTQWLDEFISKHEAHPVDLYNATGPIFTYQHVTLPNRSYIDHIIASINLLGALRDVKVLEPSYLNTGDHLPITTTLKLTQSHDNNMETKPPDSDYIPTFIWKNKRFLELYNNITDNAFSNFTDDTERCSLSKNITEIHTTLRQSALRSNLER